MDLMTRAEMGRHWCRLIAGLGDFKSLYLQRFAFDDPPAGSEEEAQLFSSAPALATLRLLQGRVPDGGALYRAITGAVDDHAAWLLPLWRILVRANHCWMRAQLFVDWFRRT